MKDEKGKFKYLEHTADIKFRSYGKTLEEAFENAALAMFKAMSDDKIKSKVKKTIKAEGKDRESLLYNFLEEFIVLLDTEDFFAGEVSVKKIKEIGGKDGKDGKFLLEAEAKGDKAEKYEMIIDVKAITYNSMFVKKEGKRFICQVLLDV